MSVNYQKNLQVPVRNNNPHKHGKVGNYTPVQQNPLMPINRTSDYFRDNLITAKTCAEAFFNTTITEEDTNYNPDFPTGVNLGFVDTTLPNNPNDNPSTRGPNVTYPKEDNVLTDPNANATSRYNRSRSDNYGYTIENDDRDNRGFDGGETIGNIKDRYNAG
jgi:hypothetical protein